MSLTMIFISAILVNNIVLSQFLGICPFLGVSKKNLYRSRNGRRCNVCYDNLKHCNMVGIL